MPRKEEVTHYKFDELSKEAKERAIKGWVENEHAWDYHDSDNLSEDFKEILKEMGFEDGVEVGWSLGYCQGDGVCFWGRLETERFLDQEGFRKYKEMAPSLYIKIRSDDRRYCHWNSMSVETELDDTRPEDLLKGEHREQFDEVRYENERLLSEYQEKYNEIYRQRMAPIDAWQDRKKKIPSGPVEWWPEDTKPAPLDIPLPEKPEPVPLPYSVKRAYEAAERKLKRMEDKLPQLEEDVKEWVRDLSKELEKIGYSEIEYRSSEEAVSETFRANDYEFTEDGEFVG